MVGYVAGEGESALNSPAIPSFYDPCRVEANSYRILIQTCMDLGSKLVKGDFYHRTS